MLIVLARATDEQVAMHVSERRLWIRDCGLEIQNASLVTVSRARDGARSQTSAPQFGLSQRAPERRCERNAP